MQLDNFPTLFYDEYKCTYTHPFKREGKENSQPISIRNILFCTLLIRTCYKIFLSPICKFSNYHQKQVTTGLSFSLDQFWPINRKQKEVQLFPLLTTASLYIMELNIFVHLIAKCTCVFSFAWCDNFVSSQFVDSVM